VDSSMQLLHNDAVLPDCLLDSLNEMFDLAA